jgi:hypothetical protein
MMKCKNLISGYKGVVLIMFLVFSIGVPNSGMAGNVRGQAERWSEQKVQGWYARQPWLAGCDYIPASAINQIEMWQ